MSRRGVLRVVFTIGVVTGLVIGPTAVALADDELDRYLAEAAAADYSGTAVVVSSWEGDRVAAVVEVHKSGSTVVVESGGESVTIAGDGSLHDASGTLRMSGWSAAASSDRYRVGEPRPVVVVGRPALELDITEEGDRRAVITVDEATGAVLATTVLDGAGEVFRESTFTTFAPGAAVLEGGDAGPGYTMMMVTPVSDLPTELAGYRLADGYRDGGGVAQAYFSDGLFSFSVFELDASTRLEVDDAATVLDVGGDEYAVMVEPSRLLVAWRAESGDYLLVGDLPPDHLEAVLRLLPAPGSEGIFDRVWRSLFG
jgi:hypothetical protein